jgi:hypothetical protein
MPLSYVIRLLIIMITKNREDFNQCVTLACELLYKNFPQETSMVVDNLATEPLDEEMMDNYFATIRFLQREGFIRYQEFDFGTFCGTVLTTKGLNVLDTIPDTFNKEETIAQRLSNALKENNKEAISNVVKEIIKFSVVLK